MAYFLPVTKPEELIAHAWLLEDGSRKFYHALSKPFRNKEAAAVFQELAQAERHQMSSLLTLYIQFTGKQPNEGFPWSVLSMEQYGFAKHKGYSKKVFRTLSDEEKLHLQRLITLSENSL